MESLGRVWLRQSISKPGLQDLKALFTNRANKNFRVAAKETVNVREALVEIENLAYLIQPNSFAMRVVGFNKGVCANWSLPWHQDRVISVHERQDVAGYTNWSSKTGVWHCEPPVKILENIVFARIYLDDVTQSSGDMQILLGSHKCGKIKQRDISAIVNQFEPEVCNGKAGDVLLCKALILHASPPSSSSAQRRILRVDFSNSELENGLNWTKYT